MLSLILNDLGDGIAMVLDFNNIVMLIAVLVLALVSGLRMGSYGRILGAILEATLLLAVFSYLWNWLSTPNRFSLTVWEGESMLAWNRLMGLTGQQLVGYLAVFFILISAVFVIKSFANR